MFFVNCLIELERLFHQVAELIGGKCAMLGCHEIPNFGHRRAMILVMNCYVN